MCSLNIRKAIYIFTIAAVSMQLFGCGGNGDSDNPPYNPAWVEINYPETDPHYTESESQYISGEGFISDGWYRCCSGSAEDTGVKVTWHNVTTGANANAHQWIRYCSFLGHVYLCDHTWSATVPLAMGANQIVITASDPGYSNTDTITIIREPETTPPTVSSTIPADQATDVAVNTPVTVTFSEEMDSSTINTNTVVLSSTADQVTGSITYTDQTATFVPASDLAYETQYTAHVTTSAKDLSGNALAEEHSWSFTTGDAPDTAPPTVTSVKPIDGTECVAIDSTLWIYFSEPMTPTTINSDTFTLTDLSTTNQKFGSVGYTDTKATFQPYSSLAIGTSYMATITNGVTDLAGNAMTENYSWTFSTPLGSSGEWNDTSTVDAPSARWLHTAVWTGMEMIVWGGNISSLYDEPGGIYHPETDSWRLTAIIDKRRSHTAVWTGSEMIVWGGEGPDGLLNTGGLYNPVTDTWLPTSLTNAPAPRSADLAASVWSGSELIVWGGRIWDNDTNRTINTNTGGRYNPVTDSWQATSTVGAPEASSWPTAVWTGSEMLVWGSLTNKGGRYNPETDSWQPISTIGAPSPREWNTAIWTGSEMIVWGGSGDPSQNTGGIYNPETDTWRPMTTHCAPYGEYGNTAIWDGNNMIILGKYSNGSSYNPVTDTWHMLPLTNAPTRRYHHSAVWTGTEMIIWGGAAYDITDTGGRYAP